MSGSMNGLDPSIPLHAGQGVTAPVNPLALYGQFAGVQNALTQNRAMEAGIANTQQATQGAAQQQAFQRYDMLGKMALSLVGQYPDGVPDDVFHSTIAHAVGAGLLKQGEVGQLLMNAPSGPALNASLTRFGLSTLAAGEAMNRVVGAPTLVNTGGAVVPQLVSQTGAKTLPGATGTTLSPSEQNAMVTVPVIGPDGKPTGSVEQVTGAEAARRGGNTALLPGGGFPNGGRLPPPVPGPAPSQPAQGGAPPGQPAMAPPAPAVPGARPTGSFGTTLSPAELTAMPKNAAAGADMGTALINQADAVPAQRAMLGEMDSALDQMSTGKGQHSVLNVKQFVQSFTPERLAKAFGVDPQNIASAETFQKLATQIAIQQGSALGLNTDASRASVFGGNPNMDLSKLGNRQIIHMLQGNADALAAKAQAWRESPNYNSGDYAGFSNAWNKQTDPRVFQWAHMDKDERQIMLSGVGKDKAELAAKIRSTYAP